MLIFLPSNLELVDAEALLASAESMEPLTRAWPPGAAGTLSRPDWRALTGSDEVKEFGRVVEELFKRGEAGRLTPEARDRALGLHQRLREALPEAAAFFDRQRDAIKKMKARSLMHARAMRRRAENDEKKLQRLELTCHPDDAEALRAAAAEMLKKRGIEPPEARRPGRPTKAEIERRRAQAARDEALKLFFSSPKKTP